MWLTVEHAPLVVAFDMVELMWLTVKCAPYSWLLTGATVYRRVQRIRTIGVEKERRKEKIKKRKRIYNKAKKEKRSVKKEVASKKKKTS